MKWFGKKQHKSNTGYCVICEKTVTFIEYEKWLRDYYRCNACDSIPRQRAIINALNTFLPNWRLQAIHESSPCGISSDYIKRNCNDYSESQFFLDKEYGLESEGIRCENLECMTFGDEVFDIFVTQDVLEHVMNPELAFAEIHRVLRKGGKHVFTMPWYPQYSKSIQRVRMENGNLVHMLEPMYHGNPVNSEGSIVTYDWGLDFIDFIHTHANMSTMVYLYKDRNLGLDADFLHVFISFKS
ncbi:MAG: class I SAM-dependent methyltransferase [Clostridiales bacterium]|nr:class I SAM-dependent methyltransferase [Clostridiales bacterium]